MSNWKHEKDLFSFRDQLIFFWMFILHSKNKIKWNLNYDNILLKQMPEDVQPVNYFIKWSRILLNIAHVNHYVLLLMIWDFYLEFVMFLTLSYFWTFTLVSIKKIFSFTFLRCFNSKVEYKGVLSIFLFLVAWLGSIPYLTILALPLPFRNFRIRPWLCF